MFYLSNNSKNNRKDIDPRLIEISDLAITISLIDFGHGRLSGLRTPEEQNTLYLDKKSTCDGYIRLSKHQSGLALDFYAYVDGKASWDEHHLSIVACSFFQAAMILGYRIKWGGMWKRSKPNFKNGIPYGWDCPHIELIVEE